jgi:hypothetical protein
MNEPVWELNVAQRGSTRRFIAAYFNPVDVIVQVALVEPGGRSDFVKIEERTKCNIEMVPDALWNFFISKVSDKQNPFSFKENLHLNIQKPGKPAVAYCMYVRNEDGVKLEEFRAFFMKVISDC